MKSWERKAISDARMIERTSNSVPKIHKLAEISNHVINPIDLKLTPEQIQNWRRVLCSMFGPYALIMTEDEIQKTRDNMQNSVNSL